MWFVIKKALLLWLPFWNHSYRINRGNKTTDGLWMCVSVRMLLCDHMWMYRLSVLTRVCVHRFQTDWLLYKACCEYTIYIQEGKYSICIASWDISVHYRWWHNLFIIWQSASQIYEYTAPPYAWGPDQKILRPHPLNTNPSHYKMNATLRKYK